MSYICMTSVNKYLNKNIFGKWELFTYDINEYCSENQNINQMKKDIPYVSSNIGFKINDEGCYNHVSNNEIEKESLGGLENNIRQNGDRFTRARTKQ